MIDYRTKLWSLLTSEEYTRLCECRSLKKDIVPIAKCFMFHKNQAAEDALVSALEHLDCNNQYFDLSREEFDNIVAQLKRTAPETTQEQENNPNAD